VIGIDKPVERRLNRLARPLRLAVLTMLAVMLVLHLGPICEAVANAAPVASEMADCEEVTNPRRPRNKQPARRPAWQFRVKRWRRPDLTLRSASRSNHYLLRD
jgi:hypothetical protein